ncbi:hypothetical protein IE077_002610, partial [Cardiosporidium cionae]
WGINEWSSFASILCAIDCTVLPLFMGVISFMGFANPVTFATMHSISCWAALYIMLPLGSLASFANFLQHRNKLLLCWGVFGLFCIFLAHSHLSAMPDNVSHWLHQYHGWISLTGVANLLASNYLSHKKIHAKGLCQHHSDLTKPLFSNDRSTHQN